MLNDNTALTPSNKVAVAGSAAARAKKKNSNEEDTAASQAYNDASTSHTQLMAIAYSAVAGHLKIYFFGTLEMVTRFLYFYI